MKVWFITDQTIPTDGDPGSSLVCISWTKKAALQYLRDRVIGEELFDSLVWELSADNPDYHYGFAEWDGKANYFFLCSVNVIGVTPPNKSLQGTTNLGFWQRLKAAIKVLVDGHVD